MGGRISPVKPTDAVLSEINTSIGLFQALENLYKFLKNLHCFQNGPFKTNFLTSLLKLIDKLDNNPFKTQITQLINIRKTKQLIFIGLPDKRERERERLNDFYPILK